MNRKSRFETLLALRRPVILDGGLATELEASGHDLGTSLWSAALLMNQPQAIVDAHLAYLHAGAQIILTATYQASIDGFIAVGMSKQQAKKMMLDAVRLAQRAVSEHCKIQPATYPPLIAASIGPYGAYLADGSEYRGNYQVEDHVLAEFHLPRLTLLDHSGVDILGCETIPSFQEARVLAEQLKDVHTPAWISFSCSDKQHLNDGTRIEQAAGLFAAHPNVHAIGINCTAPAYIGELVERINSVVRNKSIIVYPNSGELYDTVNKTWVSTDDSQVFNNLAHSWFQQGVQIVGGCCRIGPEQIKALVSDLRK